MKVQKLGKCCAVLKSGREKKSERNNYGNEQGKPGKGD